MIYSITSSAKGKYLLAAFNEMLKITDGFLNLQFIISDQQDSRKSSSKSEDIYLIVWIISSWFKNILVWN